MDIKLSIGTIGAAFISLVTVLPGTALGTNLTLVSSREKLGANNLVDWAVVGPAFSPIDNPFSATSSKGLNILVSKSSGIFSSSEQTSDSDGPFSANFAPGDALISTTGGFPGGPVTITFRSPVLGTGTQVESFENGPFTVTIEALDRSGQSLGSFSVRGTANYGGSGDNTAPFVGVLSDSADIASIRINGERAPGVGFAFNQLSIVSASVPEPDFSLLGPVTLAGFLCVKLMSRFNRK